MKIINKKNLSEIEEEKEQEKIILVEDLYEIIASMGEEIHSLTNRITKLEGGINNG